MLAVRRVVYLPSFATLFLFGTYYAVSTLFVMCLIVLFTTSIQLRHIFKAALLGNLLSVLFSVPIFFLFFNPITQASTLPFALSNVAFQTFFLLYEGASLRTFIVPLIIGNSLAYWLIFPMIINVLV